MAKQTIVSIRDKGDNRSIILESFGKNIVIIGKSPNADIVVKNIKVSNYHGRFYKEGDNWFYQDMESTSGSSVNGNRIQQTMVFDGLRLTLDANQFPDSLYLDISVSEVAGAPGGYGDPYGGYGAAAGGYNGGYGSTPAPSYGTSPAGSYGGVAPYGGSTTSYGSLNLFGLLSALCWAALGTWNFISLIEDFKTYGTYLDVMSDGKIYIILIMISTILVVGGMLILPIGLVIYNKKVMFIGSSVVAAGYTIMIGTIIMLLLAKIGLSLLFMVLGTIVTLLFLLSMILLCASMISMAKQFGKSYRGEGVYQGYYRPLIFLGGAIVSILISYWSILGMYRGASSISMSDLLPIKNPLQTILWAGAFVLSCVYLHVDETPALMEKYKTGIGPR